MERLEYRILRRPRDRARSRPALAGVLGSGNLEVLIEPADLGGLCRIEVDTAAVGFGEIWKRVLRRHRGTLEGRRRPDLHQRCGRDAGRRGAAARSGAEDLCRRRAMMAARTAS